MSRKANITRNLSEDGRGTPKIPSDMIKVLKNLRSYSASDRADFKKSMVNMLRSCGATYVLRNEQREWTNPTARIHRGRTAADTPFTPAPIHRFAGAQQGQRDFQTPSGQRKIFRGTHTPMHAPARAYGQAHAPAYGHEHTQAHGQANMAGGLAYGRPPGRPGSHISERSQRSQSASQRGFSAANSEHEGDRPHVRA